MTQQVVFLTREMQRAEARFGRPLGDLLREWYEVDGLGIVEIGERLGITKSAVSRWLAHFGIEARRGGPRREAVA